MCFFFNMARRYPNHRRNHQRNNHQIPMRSLLLEGFRSERYDNFQLCDIVSHVVEFAKDRDGSKFIQRKLDDATDNRKDSIFRELQRNLLDLMMNAYGNFIVQKFFDIGSDGHRQILFQFVQTHFLEMSLNKYGCRVVQKAIEKGNQTQQFTFLQQCAGNDMLRVAKDANGNHVIQRSFRFVSNAIQNHIFVQIRPFLRELSRDLYGCRVIQCIIEHGNGQHRAEVFQELYTDRENLINDNSGNYVIQHALQFCSPTQRNRMIEYILDKLVYFSLQKYASNVVEKCLNLATQDQQHASLNKILMLDVEWIRRFCIERYSNYVIQKLIESATRDQLLTLHYKLQPYFVVMGRQVCGRKIIMKLQERLDVANANNLQQNEPLAWEDLQQFEQLSLG